VLTLGVDFAADPACTALCWIRWEAAKAEAYEASCGADDDALVSAFAKADKVGIDAPFGWPDAFVEAVVEHRGRRAWPHPADDRKREALRFRHTDIEVHRLTGRWPLSVSSDRIAIATMRLAGLLTMLEQRGEAVARDGGGRLVEVYPAAALRIWKFDSQGYKRKENRNARCGLLGAIRARTENWLTLPDAVCRACEDSDDVIDAVIAGLVARARAMGLCEPIPEGGREKACREGWIALPRADSLDGLAVGSPPARL
jgi:predicted nuclease with RNAse H fold